MEVVASKSQRLGPTHETRVRKENSFKVIRFITTRLRRLASLSTES